MTFQDDIPIYIDGEQLDVKQRHFTGAELCALVNPPADNIWLDVVDALDEPIAAAAVVAVEPGIRFFTDRQRTIYIDKTAYVVRSAALTEAQLRALPTPPVPDDYRLWKHIPDDLDEPIKIGELVSISNGDRFFTKPPHLRELLVTVNRRWSVTIHGELQTGLAIKEAAIAQGVPIKADFLLSRKDGSKFTLVDDDEQIRVHDGEEFRANDGDDNS